MTQDKIYIGGLMRCCTESIRQELDARRLFYINYQSKGGDTIKCKYCKSLTIYRGDGWHWDKIGSISYVHKDRNSLQRQGDQFQDTQLKLSVKFTDLTHRSK